MGSCGRQLLTASLSLIVLVLAPVTGGAKAADIKRPAASPSPSPWQAKPKKTVPTMVALTPADPPDGALPSLAAAPIDVKIRTSVPAHEEAALANAPRSSLDYERAASPAPSAAAAPILSPPPWAPPAAAAKPGEALAMTAAAQAPAATGAPPAAPAAQSGMRSWTTDAFVGKAAPMQCHATRYQVLIDDRSGFVFPQLCEQPDGTFRFAP